MALDINKLADEAAKHLINTGKLIGAGFAIYRKTVMAKDAPPLRAKPVEWRHWNYAERFPSIAGQRIVIHASTRPIKRQEVLDIVARIEEGTSALKEDIALPLLRRILDAFKCQGVVELSAGIGTAVIERPRRATDFFRGTTIADSVRIDRHVWAWPLSHIVAFSEPVPARGAQGFWEWPYSIPSARAA